MVDINSILRTKFHRPHLTEDLVVRNSLIELLEKNIYKPLSLISAPAGYGKSIIVSQWLEHTSAKYGWISLDEEHNNLRVFLLYLTTAIENIFPGSLTDTKQLLEIGNLPPTRIICHSLINELDMIKSDFILVLDDFHLISDEKIHELINEMLKFPPVHLHLAILARRDPAFSINTLRLHDRVTEIRIQELTFNENEIIEFFHKLYKITLKVETSKLLLKKTEGWIVAIRLASLTIDKYEQADQILKDIGDDIFTVSEFLVEEILNKQPPGIQKLLLRSSILNRFCAELVNEISFIDIPEGDDKISGDEFLNRLVKSNLFIISLDFQNKWFRYHHLFQELLKNQLEKRFNAGEIAEIRLKVSTWFEGEELIEEAIHHALAAGNSIYAAKIVERHRIKIYDNDKWYITAKWLSMFPEDVQQQQPILLLIKAWISYERSEILELGSTIEHLEILLPEDSEEQELVGELHFFQGYFLYFQGEGAKSLKCLEEASLKHQGKSGYIQGEIELMLGIARQMCGQQELAVKLLNQKLHQSDNSNIIYNTRLLGGLGFIFQISGEMKFAIEASQRMYNFARKNKTDHTLAWVAYLQAMTHFHTLDLQKALIGFATTTDKRKIGHTRVTVDAMAAQAITSQLMHKPDRADEIIIELYDFLEEIEDPESWIVAQSCQARLGVLRGDLSFALNWAHVNEFQPDSSSLFFWLQVPSVTKARVLIAEGSDKNLQDAVKILEDILQLTRAIHVTCHEMDILILLALAFKNQGKTNIAYETLEQAVRLAKTLGWIRPFVEPGKQIAEMLKVLLDKNVEIDFIHMLLDIFAKQETERTEINKEQFIVPAPSTFTKALTFRELEIIKLLADGLRNKEIANKLFVSEVTVKKHLYNIFKKLDVKNRILLIQKAKELNLLNS